MAERKPIFLHKRSRPQIGYIEGDEVFDLSGNRRCIYNAANGNLADFHTGNIVGHISLQGFFVGTSWIADELFGQHAPAKHDIPAAAEMRPRVCPKNAIPQKYANMRLTTASLLLRRIQKAYYWTERSA
jgi:hypothetical protein